MNSDAVAEESALQVRLWSEGEFAAARQAWGDLLSNSDADPLFMSWDWQWRWWVHHQRSLAAELRLVAVYSGNHLVGLAPFYVHTVVERGGLHPRRMELIGTAWRNPRAAFSEYLDFVVHRELRSPVAALLSDWLSTATWDDLVLCSTREGGIASELARYHLPRIARVREADPLTGWRAPLPDRFDAYVNRLSPDVRRRLLHQRRKLDHPAVHYAHGENICDALALLWRFSADRWGGQEPGEPFRAFYIDIAQALSDQGRLRLSSLETRDGSLSIMFNALAGKCVYYLQSGFNPLRKSGISPGYLHFGYAVEAACAEGMRQFDFLGGSGRHRDYKRDLLTENVPLMTYHAVRGVWARGLYATYGAWLRVKGVLCLE